MLKNVLFLLLATFIQAQEISDWTVWVYEPDKGLITIVEPDGYVVLDFELTLPDRFENYPERVSVSPDGTMIGYIVKEGENQVLAVWKWLEDDLITVDLPDSAACSAIIFHETDETAALRHELYRFTWHFSMDVGEHPDRDQTFGFACNEPEQGTITVYDAANDKLLYEHREDQTLDLLRYRDDEIIFGFDDEAFTWDVKTNSVEPNPFYLASSAYTDYLSTGEAVMATVDSEGRRNTLTVYDPVQQESFPFYMNSDVELGKPYFIQNGERIFVTGYDADDELTLSLILNRDGTEVLQGFGAGSFIDVVNVPDGMTFTASIDPMMFAAQLTTAVDEVMPDGNILFYSEDGGQIHLVYMQTAAPVPEEFETKWTPLSFESGE